jgi:hypothetical protein
VQPISVQLGPATSHPGPTAATSATMIANTPRESVIDRIVACDSFTSASRDDRKRALIPNELLRDVAAAKVSSRYEMGWPPREYLISNEKRERETPT